MMKPQTELIKKLEATQEKIQYFEEPNVYKITKVEQNSRFPNLCYQSWSTSIRLDNLF